MQQQIRDDFNAALKRGDKPKVEALRLLISALNNARIAQGHDLNEEDIIRVIRKEIKQRVESRDIYAANNRQDLAAKEELQRGIYAIYIPAEMSMEQLRNIIQKLAKDLGDGVMFAQLMPAVMKKVAGKVEGKIVAEEVRKYIEEKK
jgi:uncharacterized protein